MGGPIGPDPALGEEAITVIDVEPAPKPGGFASDDGTETDVTFTNDFIFIHYEGDNADSYGGSFISFDNPLTEGTTETVNLNTLFPGGQMVFQMDSPGSSVSEVTLEVKDADGDVSTVVLNGILDFGQRWGIPLNRLDNPDLDLSQIVEINFVIKGIGVKDLNIKWGNFAGPIGPDPALGEEAITVIDVEPAPKPGGFASEDGTVIDAPFTNDFIFIHYVGNNANSYGGSFISFDNPLTEGTTETVNLNTLFPGGQMVFQMDSPGLSVSEVTLEVKDADGDVSTVVLSGILYF